MGDLTGDRKVEAVVEISTYVNMCAGRHKQRVLVAFGRRRGKTFEIARFAVGPYSSVPGIRRGRVLVRRRESVPNGERECTAMWRLVGGRFKLGQTNCGPTMKEQGAHSAQGKQ